MRRSLLAALFPLLALAAPLSGAGAQMRMGQGMMPADQCEPGMGMMCMMGEHPRMMREAMAQRAEQRLAALKARLKITEAQAKPWDAYAAAVRDAAKAMTDQHATMREKMRSGALPQRVEMHEAMLVSQLEHLRKAKAALTALYAVLSDEQKKIADAAMLGPTMRGPMRGSRTP
jgi:hypothetical protein